MKAMLLAAGLAAGLSLAAAPPPVGPPGASPGEKIVPLLGDPAPDFSGTWMSYNDSSLAMLQGKVVFIEFWRTW